MVYRVDFNRPHFSEPNRELTASCNGVEISQLGGRGMTRWEGLIAVAVLEANPDAPDDEVEYWDKGTDGRNSPMRCMTAPSLHALAAAHKARMLPAQEGAEPKAPREPKESRPLVTAKQQEGFLVAFRYDIKKWGELHGKTTRTLLENKWVELRAGYPCVTEEGARVAALYDIRQPANAKMPQKAMDAEPVEVSGEKRVQWKEAHRKAFQVAIKGNANAWREIHGKTTGWMVREEWVTVVNGKPTPTEKGMRQAVLNAVPVR